MHSVFGGFFCNSYTCKHILSSLSFVCFLSYFLFRPRYIFHTNELPIFRFNSHRIQQNLNSQESCRSDYPHTQTKEGQKGNDRRFYKTLINLFLRGKSRLWYAKSRYSSLTFLQLMKKNSPDPKGLLGWTHQLEPTSRDCIRDLEIPPNRRINSIWIEFTSIAEKNVFQFIMEY